MTIARSVFLAWEKLRIAYILILAVVTLLLTGMSGANAFRNWQLLPLIVVGAFVANIAYFAGPSVETYVRWLGYNKIWPRWFMFVVGTLFAIGLAIGALASTLLPNQP